MAKVVTCLSSYLFIVSIKDFEKINRSFKLERAPPKLLIVVVISALRQTFSPKFVKVSRNCSEEKSSLTFAT